MQLLQKKNKTKLYEWFIITQSYFDLRTDLRMRTLQTCFMPHFYLKVQTWIQGTSFANKRYSKNLAVQKIKSLATKKT